MSFQTVAWNETQIAMLTRMWGDGDSASVIADAIGDGATRSAVIGKVHRIGLPARKTRRSPLWGGPRASAKPRQPRVARARLRTVRQPTVTLVPIAPAVEPDTGFRCTLLELDAHKCRWPIGDPSTPDLRFCGTAPIEGLPYCPYHCRIAYQPHVDRRRERRGVRA